MEQVPQHNPLTPAVSPLDVAISDRAGPKLTAPSPAVMPHPIESSVEDFKMFISFVFSVSIFGASTFAVVVGQMTDPADIWKPDPPPLPCRLLEISLPSRGSALFSPSRLRDTVPACLPFSGIGHEEIMTTTGRRSGRALAFWRLPCFTCCS
ncbi:hypothetical protein BKA56DRAFT_575376 [Ilyonectria sp. MPI-CAGE-AT-0026]|nr:hypothetical protein BKA56DRAFT_575376 [Ilyonectria sp. MPI-CAGE-AT-0026]